MELSDNEQELADYLRKSMHNSNPSHGRITLQELANLISDDVSVSKRSGVWFGPRLGKRSKRSISDPQSAESVRDEYLEDIVEFPIAKYNTDAFQNSPYFVFLLAAQQPNFNKNRFLTPRLGRDANENLELQRARPPFAPRLGKKSLPFSPRLGRNLLEIVQK